MSRYNDDPTFGTEEPSRLDVLIAQVQKTAKSDYVGAVHALSVRLPTFVYGTVEALCKHSGMSRNKMIVQLLEVALEEVFDRLPEGDLQELCELRNDCIVALIGQLGDHAQAKDGEC